MAHLFEPIKVGGLELKNRFMRSATWDATADKAGMVTDKSVNLYERLGNSGIGLVVSGFAFVSPLGQAVPAQYGIHTDQMMPGLQRMIEAVRCHGTKVALQIAHSGINSGYLAGKGIESLALSSLPEIDRPHREIKEDEIEGIIDDFVAAAVRARVAGFDAIQLHGAHGYLMSQAESPLFNQRTDQWGGNPENRRRFHLEIIRRIRKAIGSDFPLLIKFGVMDDREGGLTLDEGIETARQMVAAGIDAIEVSAGVGEAIPIARKDNAELTPFRERAYKAKHEISIPVMLVGGIRTLETAKDIIKSGDADMVSMCRPFIREPGLVARWQRGEQVSAKCISCNRCLHIGRRGDSLDCNEERSSKNKAYRS
jgi:2,4-dienoyl-CoA reductase-like NADH-dependent reductase (Old Yellow Enzyme family)